MLGAACRQRGKGWPLYGLIQLWMHGRGQGAVEGVELKGSFGMSANGVGGGGGGGERDLEEHCIWCPVRLQLELPLEEK